MDKKDFLHLTAIIFSIVSFLHLTRYFIKLDILIGTYPVPGWLSLGLGVFALYMAYTANNLSKKK